MHADRDGLINLFHQGFAVIFLRILRLLAAGDAWRFAIKKMYAERMRQKVIISILIALSLLYFSNGVSADMGEKKAESKTIINQNVKLFAQAFGNYDDVPVLLIAGAMAPSIFWNDYFCQTLSSKDYLVIRFDNRDIGRSTHFQQSAPDSGIALPYSIEDMVEDAKAVLDSVTDKSAHIIGHSLGGSIAQLFAISNTEKVRSVTVISGPILAKGEIQYAETDPAITEELWKALMSNPMHQNYQRGAPEFLKIWRLLNGGWELDEDMADSYTRSLYETEIIGPAWNHTNVQNGIRDILNELEKTNKPLLFIHGEKDYLPANPENTMLLAKHLQNAEGFILPNGGHMFFNKKIWDILIDRITRHIK